MRLAKSSEIVSGKEFIFVTKDVMSGELRCYCQCKPYDIHIKDGDIRWSTTDEELYYRDYWYEKWINLRKIAKQAAESEQEEFNIKKDIAKKMSVDSTFIHEYEIPYNDEPINRIVLLHANLKCPFLFDVTVYHVD